MSLAIDLRNINHPKVNNFTVLLMRLMCKSDTVNFNRLRKVYPLEAEMVNIYKNEHEIPMRRDSQEAMIVDYDEIERMARERLHKGFSWTLMDPATGKQEQVDSLNEKIDGSITLSPRKGQPVAVKGIQFPNASQAHHMQSLQESQASEETQPEHS